MYFLKRRASVNSGIEGLRYHHSILIAMSPIGIYVGLNKFYLVFSKNSHKNQWKIIYLESMIGAGTAAYAAFLIIGSRAFFSSRLPPHLTWIPWVIAPSIGVSCGKFLSHLELKKPAY